jgi:hypothetical protein
MKEYCSFVGALPTGKYTRTTPYPVGGDLLKEPKNETNASPMYSAGMERISVVGPLS